MSEYTRGPWKSIVPPSLCLTDRFIVSESGETVAEVGGKYSMLDGDIFTVVANADLIAAAPEMLDVLKMLYAYTREFAPSWSEVERARNIIAKAEGKP